MSNFRNVGKFCSLVATSLTSTSDSIAAFNGSILGEGALAYCTTNQKSYRFTSATIPTFSPMFLPANVGGGTWVLQEAEEILSCYGFGSASYTAAPAQSSLGLGFWTEFKTGSGFYTTLSGFGGTLVTINSTTGLILADGSLASYRNVPFLLTMQFSVGSDVAGQVWEFDITKASGGNVGNNVQSQTAAQTSVQGAVTATSVVINQVIFLTPGLGYEPVFRCVTSGTAKLVTAYYQVSIVPVGIA